MDTNTKNSILCRQSSTRWIPTPDQIRILRDLYYNNGVRSPTAEQIQRISARLRQYGKIEGKNVFYWFQNHKARERQKKKLTMDMSNSSTITNVDCPCSDNNRPGNTNINVPYHGFYDVGQMGGNEYGGAPVFMQRSIRESFLTGGEGGTVMDSNMGWMGVEPTMPWMYHHLQEEEPLSSPAATRAIETLPLFPTHSQEQEEEVDEEHHNCDVTHHHSFLQQNGYHHYQYCSGNGGGASLELTLNSYCCAHPGSI